MWSTFPIFGSTLLLAVMVVASYTFAVSLSAGSTGRIKTLQAARFGAYGTVTLIAVTVLCLAYAFVSHDFRLRYVAHYSDRSMPTIFLLTALWGGQDGSLLWWLFLLSIYIGVCVWQMGKKHLDLQPYVIATLMVVVVFFCVLMAFAANPFSTSVAGARTDGEGLNPLLQNFYMIIHPPSLYTGFVGCTIPFAFCVAALVTGRLDAEWIQACRKFTIFALLFLAIGNTLGMLWAYEELGWGGYWAWDPVENAAFMPLLSIGAFTHSVMIQERRGMLKVWNVFLMCLTFFMTIFGTFLTRSGAIASVHSFAQSSIGEYFLWFLGFVASFCLTLVMYRWPELRGIDPAVGNKERFGASRNVVGFFLPLLCGVGGGLILLMIASYGWKQQLAQTGMTAVIYALAAGVAAAAFIITRKPIEQWLDRAQANVLRGAAIASGWVVVSGLAPGAWVLSGKVEAMHNASVRVAVFSVVVGVAVYCAVELVFRRMTRGLKLTISRPRMESIFSREFTFLLNNFGLLGIMLFVLVATTFPMVSEALWNEKVTVGPPYYNAWMQPLGLTVFFLMGVGTLFGWKKTSPEALRRAFIPPVTAFWLAVAAHFALGKRVGFPRHRVERADLQRLARRRAPRLQRDYAGPRLLARRIQHHRHHSGIRVPVPRTVEGSGDERGQELPRPDPEAGSSGRRDPGPPGVAALAGPDRSSPLRRLHRSPRHRAHVLRLHRQVMDGRQGDDHDAGLELPGRAPDREVRRPADGSRQQQAHDLRRRSRLRRGQGDRAARAGEVHLQEDARLADHRSGDAPLAPRRPLSRRWYDLARDKSRITPDPLEPARGLHLVRLHHPDLRQLRVHVARAPASGIQSVEICARCGRGDDEHHSRSHPRAHAVSAFAQSTVTQQAGSVQMDTPQERQVFGALRCMCGTCARELLSSCACSTADQTRERLRTRLAKGETPQSIIDEYVTEYGTASLAIPPDKGAMKAIYAAPLFAIFGGGIGLAFMLRRWRSNDAGAKKKRDASEGEDEPQRDKLDDRIDQELKDLDDE